MGEVEAMTIVANLLDAVDMIRLFATRDNIYPPGNNPAGHQDISQWITYKEYLRFLTIKVVCIDTPALDLSPSYYIDQLWHAHILDTRSYGALQQKFPNRLEHDPVPSEGLHAQRLRNTYAKYQELFDEDPLREATSAIWSEASLSVASSGSSRQHTTPPPSPPLSAPPPAYPGDTGNHSSTSTGSVTFNIRQPDGSFYISARTTDLANTYIVNLKSIIHVRKGLPRERQRLMCSGHTLNDSMSVEEVLTWHLRSFPGQMQYSIQLDLHETWGQDEKIGGVLSEKC